MFETLLAEVNRCFPDKGMLTVEEICKFLECDRQTVYNWVKRTDCRRQPPRIVVGKGLRFPTREFVRWLTEEQMRAGVPTQAR